VTLTLSVEAAGRTHVGLVRRRNEDSLYVGRSLVAVADGLGGHVAGDIASVAVIETLQSHDHVVDPADLPAALGRAVNAANEALRKRIETEPKLAGMGSTLVAMLWSGTAAVLANVGDSRAYLLRGPSSSCGGTSQITEDHTYEHLVADAANVPDLPERLSRWLDGRADGRSPDLTPWDLRPGDRFMLCSDGLSAVVPRELIHATLNSSRDPDETADRLTALAIDHGGPDNITVIVIDVRAR
jgi:serine/threonine protein phosphatase PrpC